MRQLTSRPLTLALIALAALPITGCARNKNKSDIPYVARDVSTLYNAAKVRLDQRQYKLAAVLFDEVERQHPYSVWARRAQLMSAFCYYLDQDYTKSIQSAQRFLSIHPGNRDAPYAYYLIALSYYDQIADVTRDQKITQQALDSLTELERRYPATRYAADARLKVDLVRDHLAGKEMEIGRFYEHHGQWLAATLRFRRVVDDYQTTTHVPEALMRLTESYLALGVPEEARKSAAVLGANYPATDWYKRAYRLSTENAPKAVALATPGAVLPAPVRPPIVTPPTPAATPAPAASAAPAASPTPGAKATPLPGTGDAPTPTAPGAPATPTGPVPTGNGTTPTGG